MLDVVFVLPLKEHVLTKVTPEIYQDVLNLLMSSSSNRISIENVIIEASNVRAAFFPYLDRRECTLVINLQGGPTLQIPIFSQELGRKALATIEILLNKNPTQFFKTIEQDFGRYALLKHDTVIEGVQLYAA